MKGHGSMEVMCRRSHFNLDCGAAGKESKRVVVRQVRTSKVVRQNIVMGQPRAIKGGSRIWISCEKSIVKCTKLYYYYHYHVTPGPLL